MPSHPLALSPALPSELLTYILAHQAYPTTVIICQPRGIFLTSLLQSLPAPSPLRPADPNNAEAVPDELPTRHPLLVPTLHQVATSRTINLVFVPSVAHLRAYLSVFPPKTGGVPHLPELEKPGKSGPLIVVYGLLELHRDTREWSAQGLGNTVAGLVEAGRRGERGVVVFEERRIDDEQDYFHGDEEMTEEEAMEGKRRELVKGWEEEVPMLSGGARKGIGMESDGGWSGRMVEVGRVLGRWFRFERGDWGDL